METVLIIGAGAAGMTAAITAATNGRRAILIEKQARVGKKLLATGNGCCNLSNTCFSADDYFGEEKDFCLPALSRFGLESTLEFFKSLGLLTRTEKDGRIYPYSMQASGVLDVLRFALDRPEIELRCETSAISVKRKGEGFETNTDKGTFQSDKLIVAAGGAAAPKLGGTMDGYKILSSFGHSRTSLYPSLVQVKTENTYPRALKGIKTDAQVKLYGGSGKICDSFGEVLFTEYGLSGPAIFEISRFVSTGKDLTVSLDLMPEYDGEKLSTLLRELQNTVGGILCENFLAGILNKRLGQMVMKYSSIALTERVSELRLEDVNKITRSIKDFRHPVTGTMGLENAQVTAGGIRTKEFNAETLESKICPNLFAAGEVLDIDGRCGGYNLQWAWSSGRLAGKLGKL